MSEAMSMSTTTVDEEREIEAANESGRTPVVFVHGLWLLPSSWDRWAELFEHAGYAALTPGWPDDPDTVEQAREHPEVLAGKSIGGPKLAPLISPNKTWAGLAGGVAAAGICGLIAAMILGTHIPTAVLFSMVLAPVAQIGDIGESAVKRYFGVKDSGSILPGHGGILDRIDGLVVAAAFVAAVRLLGGEGMPWR